MTIAQKSFNQIGEADLRELIDFAIPEGLLLEYKREAYGGTEADRREFLKDLSALANTNGGHLIIGLEEDDRLPVRIVPLAGNVDPELQRLNGLLQAGLEPRVIGVQMQAVPVAGGNVIVIRVPRSSNPPHRVIAQNSNRFYGRSAAGAYELSVEELRRKFTSRLAMAEQVAGFRRERLALIESRSTAIPLRPGRGTLVFHLIPQWSFEADDLIDVRLANEDALLLRRLSGDGGVSRRYSADGVANIEFDGPGGVAGYNLLFRNGIVEAVSCGCLTAYNGVEILPARPLERAVFNTASAAMRLLDRLGIAPPLIASISVLDVHGGTLHRGERYLRTPEPFSVRDILLPTVVVSDFLDDGAMHRAFRPAIDALWQSAGLQGSDSYDDQGTWHQ